MKRSVIVPLAAIILSLTMTLSCDQGSTPPKAEEGLVGNWRWIYSYGGYGGQYIYADSVNYSIFVRFDINSRYTEHRDDSLLYDEPYRVEKKSVWGDSADVVIIDNYPDELIIERVDRDSLILKEYCFDCYTRAYVRLGPI